MPGCAKKGQLFWNNLPMKLGCRNVVQDFKRNIRIKLGFLLKGCVHYFFASLFFMFKREHL